jgi:hypothetical protein
MAVDPQYLRLYQEYSKAIKAYDNALKDRQKVRKQLSAKRGVPAQPRHPVGAVPGRRPVVPVRRVAPARPSHRGIYLGPILGWAKVIYTRPPEPLPDPTANADWDKLYDRISQQLYWNAKSHYEKCKRAFFDYVRQQNIDVHRERAQNEAEHLANQQLLGIDDEDTGMEPLRQEIEKVCQNALGLYRTAPTPKSQKVIETLLESLADAQFVGLESPTVTSMEDAMQSLFQSGAIRLGEH